MTDGQVRVWMNRIDAIITGRPNWKGIIHTRSYERAQHIYATSRHRGIMIAHGRSNAREVVARFKAAKAPCVLVSPVMEEGYDFPYDECRYQIIVKVPFVDTRSLITQARAASDKGYLNYLTALSLIQMVGRGMRAEDDSCETFIIDDHWDWFRPTADKMGLWPRWFKASFKRHPGVPKAMMERENAGGAN
jgi:Rad3-related DNA helicase